MAIMNVNAATPKRVITAAVEQTTTRFGAGRDAVSRSERCSVPAGGDGGELREDLTRQAFADRSGDECVPLATRFVVMGTKTEHR